MIRTFLFILLLIASGCAEPPPKRYVPLSEGDAKFLSLCKDELKYDVVVKRAPNTVWIYVPITDGIFDFKASPEGPQITEKSTMGQAIRYLDVSFVEEHFLVNFDIAELRMYPKDPGYKTAYSSGYQEKQRNILTAIYRSYADVAQEQVPEFFVLVIADIQKGMEVKTMFHFKDFVRAMSDASFYEEFTRRTVTDEPIGHTRIIDDRAGKHVETEEVTWPEFLSKQIKYRVKVKYQYSAFPPGPDAGREISEIVTAVTEAYQYRRYDGVILKNLSAGTETVIPR